MQQVITFTMTVRPALEGQETFRGRIAQIVARREDGAFFRAIYLSDKLAVLSGTIIRAGGNTTEEGLSEYLARSLNPRAETDLDIDVRITARS
jgi:hypothetical protein